jgi:hypothetical protein
VGTVQDLEKLAWRFCLLHGLDPLEHVDGITQGMANRVTESGASYRTGHRAWLT